MTMLMQRINNLDSLRKKKAQADVLESAYDKYQNDIAMQLRTECGLAAPNQVRDLFTTAPGALTIADLID